MKKSLCLLLALSAVGEAQTVLTADNLNWRPGTGGRNGTGIFGTPENLGLIIPRPPDSNFGGGGTKTNPTDFLFRWSGLTLDGAGVGDDYVDFTVRLSSTGGIQGNINFGGEGHGLDQPTVPDVEADPVGISEGEEMTVEIVDVTLSPGTLGSVTFDGFTAAGFFASGSAGAGMQTEGNVTGDVDGNTVSLTLSGTGYVFPSVQVPFASSTPSFVINNIVTNDLTITPAPTIVPNARLRSLDFQFTHELEAGLPEIQNFSLSVEGNPTGENEGYYFASSETDTPEGVYGVDFLELSYDVDNLTELTLVQDGVDVETRMLGGGFEFGEFIPEALDPGVYAFKIRGTDGEVTVTSQEIVVSIDQPLVFSEASTRSSASMIADVGRLPLFIGVKGDFDTNNTEHGLFLEFADQEGSLLAAAAGGSGTPAPGNLTEDFAQAIIPEFSNNLMADSGTGIIEVPVAGIIEAIETANSITLTYPFEARLTITAVNPTGTATETIDFTIVDSQILGEVTPSTFEVGSGVLKNQWISQFFQATDVGDNNILDNSGSDQVTFPNKISGGIDLGANPVGFQAGNAFRNVSIGIWLEVPAEPVTGLIYKSGSDGTGTSLGYEAGTGELVARTQSSPTNGSQVSSVISPGWHHVLLTIQLGETSQLIMYIDGVLASTGEVAPTALNSWASPQNSALFSDPGVLGYAGRGAGFYGTGSIFNGAIGNLRLYQGLLNEMIIAELATEFVGSSSSGALSVVSVGFNGVDFEVVASGLSDGVVYYLVKDTDLPGAFATVVDTVTAAGDTETFTDEDPRATDTRALYKVTDVDPGP